MTARSIRRAAERRAKKLARKAARHETQTEVVAAPASVPEFVEESIPEPTSEIRPQLQAPLIAITTPAQLIANRANAQLSTGPRTPEGRARSSQNAVKSGLTGRTVLLPTDDVEEYATFLARFQRDLKPIGQVECELVQIVVDCFWRLRRIQALEFALYAHGHDQFEEAFSDYPEESRYNMTLLQTHLTYEKQLRNLQIQEARIDRKRAKALDELSRLQAERTAAVPERDADAFPSEKALWMPPRLATNLAGTRAVTENGFVFSDSQSGASDEAFENSLLFEKAA